MFCSFLTLHFIKNTVLVSFSFSWSFNSQTSSLLSGVCIYLCVVPALHMSTIDYLVENVLTFSYFSFFKYLWPLSDICYCWLSCLSSPLVFVFLLFVVLLFWPLFVFPLNHNLNYRNTTIPLSSIISLLFSLILSWVFLFKRFYRCHYFSISDYKVLILALIPHSISRNLHLLSTSHPLVEH